MVKKSNIEPVIDVSINSNSVPTIHSIRLETGLWKHLFEDQENKQIIAKALNYCAYKGLHIAGYLITESNIYLVLKIDTESLTKMLNIFEDTLRKEIKRHQEYVKIQTVHPHGERFKTGEAFIGLFTKHRLQNYRLIKLITGRVVEIPYHDPHLAQLKELLRKAEFCSIIDYSGAIGPVRITSI